MELEALRQMAADPTTPSHLKLGALKELARRREAAEPEPELSDPLGAMQEIVEKYCPQSAEDRNLPADPMRSLDYESCTGEKLDPMAASWLPYCPPKQVAQIAARRVVAASRRIGVGQGPYEVPEADELAQRRRTKGG
jgi:hypothetical protein